MNQQVSHDWFSCLPEKWQQEISSLAPGERWERMGESYFYLAPQDRKTDCGYTAANVGGVTVVVMEVGPEVLRRWFVLGCTNHEE